MESSEPATEPELLVKLRNMWEFANIMQYIFIFGKAVKIDEDFDIEVHASQLVYACITSDTQYLDLVADPNLYTGSRSRMSQGRSIRQIS